MHTTNHPETICLYLIFVTTRRIGNCLMQLLTWGHVNANPSCVFSVPRTQSRPHACLRCAMVIDPKS